MPPITTLKITNTVQSVMLNEAGGAIRSFCNVMIAPAIPRNGAVPRKHRMRARLMLTPIAAAPSSLSRIAVSPIPMRERSRKGASESQRRQREGEPIDCGEAVASAAAERQHDRDRQAGPRAAAERLELAGGKHQDLGDDPAADRQIGGAQAEHEQHRRYRDQQSD